MITSLAIGQRVWVVEKALAAVLDAVDRWDDRDFVPNAEDETRAVLFAICDALPAHLFDGEPTDAGRGLVARWKAGAT